MKKLKLNVSEDHHTISRCLTQSSTSGTDPIPVDLVLNILSRLSVSSIAKCRCVSKLWSSILRRPNFRQLFPLPPTRSFAQPRLLFIFQGHENLFFLSSHQSQNQVKLMSDLHVPINPHKYFPTNSSSQNFSHVNGFVCFQDQEKNATVCNPKTGEFLALPKVETEFGGRCYLGYDPINEQFKVLCTTWKTLGTHIEHHVMTLGTGTTKLLWRSIPCSEPHCPKHDGICINGVLYYPNGCSHSNKIVCFDVRSETFEFINIAQGMRLGINLIIINYKGKLGVLFSRWSARFDKGTRSIKLWVLEDAKEHKWLKDIYDLPEFWWRPWRWETELYSLGMTPIGEIVLLPYNRSYPFDVFYYNLEKNTIVRVVIEGAEGFERHKVYGFLDYVEDVKLM